MDTEQAKRYLVTGMGLHFALVFCAFLPGETLAAVSAILPGSQPSLLVLAYSGLPIVFVLPFVVSHVKSAGSQRIVMALACLMEILGVIALNVVDLLSVPLLWLGCLAFGGGTACAAVLWGIELTALTAHDMEHSLVFVLLVFGLVMLVGSIVLSDHIRLALITFPLITFACYWQASSGKAHVRETKGRPKNPRSARTALTSPELARTVIVFGLVGFIWQMYAADSMAGTVGQTILFPLGFIFGALVLLLYINYSAGLDLTSSIRWVFPIIAIGLLMALGNNGRLIPLGGLLLACAHSSLEAMLRLHIVKSATMSKEPDKEVAWGFAAITLGAVVGEVSFNLLSPHISSDNSLLLGAIYTLLVTVEALFWNASSNKQAEHQQGHTNDEESDAERRAQHMANVYGLSSREREILSHLLEGRSQPYIRDELGISISTVDTHVRHIYRKTGVNSKQDLINLSKEIGSLSKAK